MTDKRPEHLAITQIHFPPAAISSILHRISGILLLPGIAVLLWVFGLSLDSPDSFNAVKEVFGSPLLKVVLWAVLAALAYHLLAGIRHLLMDLGYLEGHVSGQRSATVTIIAGIVLALILGVWIW